MLSKSESYEVSATGCNRASPWQVGECRCQDVCISFRGLFSRYRRSEDEIRMQTEVTNGFYNARRESPSSDRDAQTLCLAPACFLLLSGWEQIVLNLPFSGPD